MIGHKDIPANQSIQGEIEYLRSVKGRKLRRPRDVIIWLPPSYRESLENAYPVLYMHDGQNIIDPATSFLGAWRADLTAMRLIKAHEVREFIIVGIYNTPERIPEYSPGGSGRRFAEFVIDELKPIIDRTYRTLPERENTAVMGSSMGGLISLLFAWWHPDVFYQAACMSSSFFSQNYKTLHDVRSYRGPKKDIRIYLDVGDQESLLRVGYERMRDALKKQGYRKGVDLEYFCARNSDHNEHAWGHRLWRPFTFLFGV